jgi:hypothetical protein
MHGNLCDKCRLPVAEDNDAVQIALLCGADPMLKLTAQPRHFLPIEGCNGSPSRAQYIDGQPRDTRGYPYVLDFEPIIRAAYDTLQERVRQQEWDDLNAD